MRDRTKATLAQMRASYSTPSPHAEMRRLELETAVLAAKREIELLASEVATMEAGVIQATATVESLREELVSNFGERGLIGLDPFTVR